jgi:hypothetical protein
MHGRAIPFYGVTKAASVCDKVMKYQFSSVRKNSLKNVNTCDFKST